MHLSVPSHFALLVVLATKAVSTLTTDPNIVMAVSEQRSFATPGKASIDTTRLSEWSISVSDNWDVLGPFPIHAREQHFLSPSFPINLSEEVDFTARFTSSYADGGTVGWGKATSAGNSLSVTFPNIRWESLRATEGWAALQHHSLLRTTITIRPPLQPALDSRYIPQLRVSVVQGSFFAVLPSRVDSKFVPEWYAGNIYGMSGSTPHAIELPGNLSLTEPTIFYLYLSGDYEIRLFGDPGNSVPTLQINYSLDLELPLPILTVQDTHHVTPDFVAGWAFGNTLGIGVRSVGAWWTITGAKLLVDSAEVQVLSDTQLAPSQTRVIPLKLIQRGQLTVTELNILLYAKSASGLQSTVHVTLPVKHHQIWNSTTGDTIRATYLFSKSSPTAFLVKPPIYEENGLTRPPLLALHGAGVEIFQTDFWPQALPRQQFSWTIIPSGRTAWGLDWHGLSAEDAWSTVNALYDILGQHDEWGKWKYAENTRVIILGHSNGGQGTWWIASRYPDRVIAAIPAAAYIKSQAYIPLILSRSAHYIDPTLRSILETSLTPDNNDLFVSNLVHTPILAIHGGNDDNVPVWHTREAVSVLKTWDPTANVVYKEDLGEKHWYPTVFDNGVVQDFIHHALESTLNKTQYGVELPLSFTLTVAVPRESASLKGWRIVQLAVPGRLGRLTVTVDNNSFVVKTRNVVAFSIDPSSFPVPFENLQIDTSLMNVPKRVQLADLVFGFEGGKWTIHDTIFNNIGIQPSGRIQNILSSSGPLIIIYSELSTSLSAALRLAHDLDTYHKLDSEIIEAQTAVERELSQTLGSGNLVVLGGTTNSFTRHLLAMGHTALQLKKETLLLAGNAFNSELATLFLHPHPANSAGLALVLFADNKRGFERAMRLFPIRTGITLPDWIAVSKEADKIGAGGVRSAGVWGNGWTWNEPMSSF